MPKSVVMLGKRRVVLRVAAETAAVIAAYPNHARARAAMPGRMSASAMEENPMSTTESG